MKKNYFTSKNLLSCIFIFVLMTATVSAQVGIGTITPEASSVLDVTSTTQGMLAPRMTTAQKNAIASPADGLMVYDTDLKALCSFNSATASWTVIGANSNQRNKFKRIRSTDVLAVVLASEKAAGGNTKYVLDSETLYEINGTINVDLPIDINNAYISGLDANDDRLVKSVGNLFEGDKGGSVRNLTITASNGMVYNLNGATSQTAVMRECVVAASSNVGTINGFGIALFTTVIYTGNSNGITYSNIGRVLLTNNSWFSSNAGTYEKFLGTFNVISRQGGLYEVVGASIGLDVSSNPVINGDADVVDVIFSGVLTTGKYINGYTTGSYPGYNFSKSWNVRAQGVPNESDEDAQGELSIDYPVGAGAATDFNNNANPSNIVKVQGNSSSIDLFRFSKGTGANADNRIVYDGKRRRYFNFSGSISFQVPAAGTYIAYVAKNGTPLTRYKVYGRGSSGGDIIALSLDGTVELANNDYLEIFVQRYSGSNGSIITPNATLIVK